MALKPARIAVLAIAIAAGGGAFMLSGGPAPQPMAVAPIIQQAAPTMPVEKILITKRDLPMGTLVGQADIDWQDWPAAAVSPGMIKQVAATSKKQVDDIVGSIARSAFLSGEPVRSDKLVKGTSSGFLSAILPAGHRAVAIDIDTAGSTTAGGFILPNDRVDIIRTYKDADATKSSGVDSAGTETILRNVRVLAIGQNVQEKNGQPVAVGTTTATLELDANQTEQVILAQRTSINARLSLALRSMLDGGTAENTATPKTADDDGPLTVVRFGYTAQVSKK